MGINFTINDAKSEMPLIHDENLKKAVELSLWMYLEKNFTLKRAIETPAKKHAIKPRAALEKVIRQIIPEEYFFSRMKYPKVGGVANFRLHKLDKDNVKHIQSIQKEM